VQAAAAALARQLSIELGVVDEADAATGVDRDRAHLRKDAAVIHRMRSHRLGRNMAMILLRCDGFSCQAIGDYEGLTRARVSDITAVLRACREIAMRP
jgi:hypothetical protein